MNEQQLAAMKLALEALKEYWEHGVIANPFTLNKAITALQSIIRQHALDKMAENARELGLSYDDEPKIGCVNHDCDKCKAVQEPVAWMEHMPVEGENVVKSVRMTSSKVVAQMLANPIPLYKGLSGHLSQASGGMVRIDPVTGNVGIGTPEAQPAVQREHITDGRQCWCNPDIDYVDPETGAAVIVHKEPQ